MLGFCVSGMNATLHCRPRSKAGILLLVLLISSAYNFLDHSAKAQWSLTSCVASWNFGGGLGELKTFLGGVVKLMSARDRKGGLAVEEMLVRE